MRFEIYLVAKGKDNKTDKLKVNMSLHCAGPNSIDKYSFFVYTNDEEKKAIMMSVANSRNCVRVLEM